jgi:hypothetical protein
MFLKFFDFTYFFISFAIGVLYIYLTNDYKKVIVMYPTPDNIGTYTYVDKSNNCFQYELDEVECPQDKKEFVEVNVVY